MKIIAIVQARYGSSRLRGKAMMPLSGGRPMLYHVLRRALAIDGVDRVVLATSFADFDAQLCWVASDLGVGSVRGDERDVLGRFVAIIEEFKPDAVMRLTGDCPLLAPDVCGRVLSAYATVPHMGYVSNDTTCSGYPDGFDCEVVAASLLRSAAVGASSADREHVTAGIRRAYGTPEAVVRPSTPILPGAKLSVDTFEDFERVRRIYGHLDDGDASSAATVAAYRRAFPSGVE